MHTNKCKNKNFIFYKMVHDQIYHDRSCRCCAESNGCETSQPSYNHKAYCAVAKREGPPFKMGRVVKRGGTVPMNIPKCN